MESVHFSQNTQTQEEWCQLTYEALTSFLSASQPDSSTSDLPQGTTEHQHPQEGTEPSRQVADESDLASELSDFDQNELESVNCIQCEHCGASLLPDHPQGQPPEYCRNEACGMPSGFVEFGDWASFVDESSGAPSEAR